MSRLRLSFALVLICIFAGQCPSLRGGTPDLRLRTIVIDPGHGGKDAGTVSADRKTYEKTLALKLSKMLADSLKASCPDVKVVLTRDKDEFIPLNTRAKMASGAGGQLFISMHINATASSKNTNGFAAYILGPARKSSYDSYEVNLEACRRENSAIYLEEDYSTTYKDFDDSPESQILLQLMQNAFREQSLAFAQKVSENMEDGPFRKNWGVMQGNFAVLRLASMPAVLLEFGYMTNADDLKDLRDEKKLQRMVGAVHRALLSYKDEYDRSVALDSSAPAPAQSSSPVGAAPSDTAKTAQNGAAAAPPQTSKEPSAAPAKPEQAGAATPAEPKSKIYYGTQVLASSKLLGSGDKFFKGFKVEVVKAGNLYKYILSPSEDRSKALSDYRKVKASFPDSFFVKVEDGVSMRESAK